MSIEFWFVMAALSLTLVAVLTHHYFAMQKRYKAAEENYQAWVNVLEDARNSIELRECNSKRVE